MLNKTISNHTRERLHNADHSMSVLTMVARSHNTAVVVGNLLKTVANAEQGNVLFLDELPEFF